MPPPLPPGYLTPNFSLAELTASQTAVRLGLDNTPGPEALANLRRTAALLEDIRERTFPHSRLSGVANVLVMPDLDAADIAHNMIKVLGDALPVGPILMGTAKPAHILGPSITARGIVNMTAVAVVEAQGTL